MSDDKILVEWARAKASELSIDACARIQEGDIDYVPSSEEDHINKFLAVASAIERLTRERDEARAALDREKARADALEDAAQVLDASARIAGKEADDTRRDSVDSRIRRDRAAILASHAAAVRDMKTPRA